MGRQREDAANVGDECAVRCRAVDDVGCRSALAVLSAVLNGSHIHEALEIGSLALVTRSTRLRAPGQHLRPHRRGIEPRSLVSSLTVHLEPP